MDIAVENLPFIALIALLAVSFSFMIFGANFLVSGALTVGARMKLSKAFLGASIVAFGTSAPELFTSLFANFKGEGDLAAGNVLGSNIFNSSLVLAVCLFFAHRAMGQKHPYRNLIWLIAPSVLFCFFASDLSFSLIEGAILLALVAVFLFQSAKEQAEEVELSDQPILKASAFLVLGMILLAVGADVALKTAMGIGHRLELPDVFIGGVILAAGTGFPELVTSIIAGLKKEDDLALGNIIGSNVLNVSGVLGLTAVIKTINIESNIFNPTSFLLVGLTVFLGLIMLWKKVPRKVLGVGLILFYGAYLWSTL